MKAVLGKYEPVFKEETMLENGKEIKTKIRKIKLSMYVDPVDFPDVTSYDGAEMDIFRPDEYAASQAGNFVIPERMKQAFKMAITVLQDLMDEAENKPVQESEREG